MILDTQSVRAATGVPAVTTGKDAAKRVPGRKRGLGSFVWIRRSLVRVRAAVRQARAAPANMRARLVQDRRDTVRHGRDRNAFQEA